MPARSTSAVRNFLVNSLDITETSSHFQNCLKAKLPDLQIAIVGAGIGGLSAAIGLDRAGFTNIVIHESVSEISEVGVQCCHFA